MFPLFSHLSSIFSPRLVEHQKPAVLTYRILRGPDVEALEKEVEKHREHIHAFIGGVTSCAWNQPGEGPVQFFAQSVMMLETSENAD